MAKITMDLSSVLKRGRLMTDHNKLRTKLLERRDELNVRLGNIKRDVTRKNSADWSEQAQERENDEVMDALGNEATLELQKINRALDRMDEGEYGDCTACGAQIPEGRLEVMPYADLCVKCAESKEGL
ncbi:MAG: TraR/DksA family transcriptional regulator [Endozoicomonas sp.]